MEINHNLPDGIKTANWPKIELCQWQAHEITFFSPECAPTMEFTNEFTPQQVFEFMLTYPFDTLQWELLSKNEQFQLCQYLMRNESAQERDLTLTERDEHSARELERVIGYFEHSGTCVNGAQSHSYWAFVYHKLVHKGDISKIPDWLKANEAYH